MQEAESTFRQYADIVMDEYKAQGKTTRPMELYLSKKETLSAMAERDAKM